MKGPHFFEKRKKEMARQEKAKQKAERKAQRKAEKEKGGAGESAEGEGDDDDEDLLGGSEEVMGSEGRGHEGSGSSRSATTGQGSIPTDG